MDVAGVQPWLVAGEQRRELIDDVREVGGQAGAQEGVVAGGEIDVTGRSEPDGARRHALLPLEVPKVGEALHRVKAGDGDIGEDGAASRRPLEPLEFRGGRGAAG